MNKLNWCIKQKDGIKLIERNELIGRKYIEEAEEDYKNIKHNSLKWKNIISYYACYNVFYGLLQKIGIKSEIHDCTIELMQLFKELNKYMNFIKELKTSRINVQYYLKSPKKINEQEVDSFILDCKNLFNEITYDEIQKIRKRIQEYL